MVTILYIRYNKIDNRDMKIINIDGTTDCLENLFEAKKDIEAKAIADGTITEKAPLAEFIINLGLAESVYYKNGSMVPYSIKEGADETYLFITGIKDTPEVKSMISKLEDCSYDPRKLKKINMMDMVNEGGISEEFFMVNGTEYYI